MNYINNNLVMNRNYNNKKMKILKFKKNLMKVIYILQKYIE